MEDRDDSAQQEIRRLFDRYRTYRFSVPDMANGQEDDRRFIHDGEAPSRKRR